MASTHPAQPELGDFSARTTDKVRYSDTDRQGHVNNAVFATYLETGRVELLLNPAAPVLDEGCSFVVASLTMQLLAEIHWPGTVDIGTQVSRLGRSSISIQQAVFQDGECVATAETIVVQVNDGSGRSQPLSESARVTLTP